MGGGGGGALRSDAKVSLRSGLCDMNDIADEKNQYRRSLYAEYADCLGGGRGFYPSKKKQKKTWGSIPGSATARTSCLQLNVQVHLKKIECREKVLTFFLVTCFKKWNFHIF